MKKQELLDILHTNIIKLLNETENGYSMRGLSTAIERSEGYIQKMLVGAVDRRQVFLPADPAY